jgi:hypothetical protein
MVFFGSMPKTGFSDACSSSGICWFCMSRSTSAVEPRASMVKSPFSSSSPYCSSQV